MKFEFSHYRSLKELFKATYYRNRSIDKAERIQDKYEAILIALERYKPRNPDYVKAREKLLVNAKKKFMMEGREMIINEFKDNYFNSMLKMVILKMDTDFTLLEKCLKMKKKHQEICVN